MAFGRERVGRPTRLVVGGDWRHAPPLALSQQGFGRRPSSRPASVGEIGAGLQSSNGFAAMMR